MSKYYIYRDTLMPTGIDGEAMLAGCTIFGVHHDCEKCPNLIEMGDEPYAISATGIQSF